MILPLLVEVTVLLKQKINEMFNIFSSCNKGKGLLIVDRTALGFPASLLTNNLDTVYPQISVWVM